MHQILRTSLAAAAVTGLAVSLTSCSLFGDQASEPTDSSEPVAVTFIYSAADHDPIRFEAGNITADYWRELGIEVTSEPMDFSALSTRLESEPESFDAFISGYVSRPERLDPDVLLYRPFHSSGVDTGVNYQGYASDEYDAVVEAQRQEIDPDTRRDLVYEAQEILTADIPAVPLYHVTDVHSYNSDILTEVTPMMGQGLWNVWTMLGAEVANDDNILRVGMEADMGSLNPFASTGGANTEQSRLVYDLLARISPEGVPEPWAAESWEQIDPLTVEVTLRDGMTFHDGTPVTSSDVKFSYEVQATGAPLHTPFLSSIESIDTPDDRTLVFNLSAPYPALFAATFSQIFILPEHIWSAADPTNLALFDNAAMIGSGPFAFERWIPNEEARFTSNDAHFSPPNVSGLINVVYATPDAIFAGLESGQVYMHDRRLLPAAIERARSVDGLEVLEIEDFGVYYIGFNLRQAPFDDLAFRQAIAQTLDFSTIVDTLLAGYAEPGHSFIAPANSAWSNPDVAPAPFDLEASRTLLEEAGYTWDSSGTLYYPAD